MPNATNPREIEALVKRLREQRPVFAASHVPIANCYKTRRCQDCRERSESADTIETLVKEIASLRAQLVGEYRPRLNGPPPFADLVKRARHFARELDLAAHRNQTQEPDPYAEMLRSEAVAIEALVKDNARLTRERDRAASTGSGCFREHAMDATFMAIDLDNSKKDNAALLEQRKRVLGLCDAGWLTEVEHEMPNAGPLGDTAYETEEIEVIEVSKIRAALEEPCKPTNS